MAHRVLIRAVSDLHGHLPDVPACDLLLIAGDICPLTDDRSAVQAPWLDRPCRAWLQGLQVGHVVVVAGNHDFVFEQPELVPPLPWTYLQDRLATVGGLRVYGTPWTPIAGHWAFQATAEELAQRLASTPTGLDVLVSHFPPRGFGDCVRPRDYSLLSRCPPEVHIGSDALLGVIDRGGPGLVVYGHIHEDRGHWKRGSSVLANVTVLDGAGVPRYPGMAFEFDLDDRTLEGVPWLIDDDIACVGAPLSDQSSVAQFEHFASLDPFDRSEVSCGNLAERYRQEAGEERSVVVKRFGDHRRAHGVDSLPARQFCRGRHHERLKRAVDERCNHPGPDRPTSEDPGNQGE